MVISFCDADLGPVPGFFHILQTKARSSPRTPAVRSGSAFLAQAGVLGGVGGGGGARAKPAVTTGPLTAGWPCPASNADRNQHG